MRSAAWRKTGLVFLRGTCTLRAVAPGLSSWPFSKTSFGFAGAAQLLISRSEQHMRASAGRRGRERSLQPEQGISEAPISMEARPTPSVHVHRETACVEAIGLVEHRRASSKRPR